MRPARGRQRSIQQRQQQPRRLRARCPPGTPGHRPRPRDTPACRTTTTTSRAPTRTSTTPTTRAAPVRRGWPRYPGLMDRAEQPVPAGGPATCRPTSPSATTTGWCRATRPPSRGFEDVATGCFKAIGPSQQFRPAAVRSRTDPDLLNPLLPTDPTKVALVPPDPTRQFVSKPQYKALHEPPSPARPTGTASASSTRPRTRPRTAPPPTTRGVPEARASASSRSTRVGEGGVVRTLRRREHRRPAVPVAGAAARGRHRRRTSWSCCSATTRSTA